MTAAIWLIVIVGLLALLQARYFTKVAFRHLHYERKIDRRAVFEGETLELQEIMTALLTAEDNTDLIYSFKSAHVVIESEEAVPWTLDGEFGGDQTHVEIDNLHEAMNLYLTSNKNQKKGRLNQKLQEIKEITQNSEE